MSDLKNQAVNSVIWTTIRTVLTSLCAPLLLIVKARYLSPAEFGVLSIINIFVSLINVLENFGFSTAVIQRDKVTKDERSSLFFLQIFFCLLIGFLIIIIAPLVANFFDMASLEGLLPLLSITMFLNGPIILFQAFLEKEFHFKELSIIQIIREVSLVAFTALLLFLDNGLLGVVWGQVIAVTIMAILILYVSFKNSLLHLKFHFKFSEVKPFIKFGLFIAGKQLMTQLTHHIDELIIGYFLNAEVLGLYHFAKNVLNRLRTLITTSFSKVLFPLLSKVKNNLSRLTKAYNDISKYIGVFAFPIFIGIALTAELFIPVLFGEQWMESSIFFVILSIAYIPYLLTANLATSLLYSVNKPNLVLYTDIVVNSIYILLLLLFSWLQISIHLIVGLYAAYLISKTVILQYVTQLYLHSTFKQYLTLFKNTVIATIIMGVVILIVEYTLLGYVSTLVDLIITISVGVIVYFIAYYVLDKKTLYEIRNLLPL